MIGTRPAPSRPDSPVAPVEPPAADGVLVGGREQAPVSDKLGTSRSASGDRSYRPDVEGLRAVAIGLVVAFHFSIPGFRGGFVGVDVFFVISGFVITGVLLRERATRGRTSFLDFYARRMKRILPAATLVILVTVLAEYVFVGHAVGKNAANAGRWAAVFLANVHFAQMPQLPWDISPLDNYWSLAVEEQFYLVFPALFAVIALVRGRVGLRTRLALALGAVIAGSLVWSAVAYPRNPVWAYNSPFTRAWELALGALVAVSAPMWRRLHAGWATLVTWVGVAMVVSVVVVVPHYHGYPSWRQLLIPVAGTALVIAGGVATPRFGAELALARGPFRWLGKRSYSLYLWHWPVLVVAVQAGVATASAQSKALLVGAAVLLSMATYRLVENPIRHWRLPSRYSVAAGLALIGVTVVLLTVVIQRTPHG